MEKAHKQAAKSQKTLADEPEPRERVLSTVRAPGPDLPGTGPSTLPILEEIGEGSSGRSEMEPRNGDFARPHTPHSFRTAEAPSGPPPSLPPPPPRDHSKSPRSKGKMREYDSEKGLPPLPNGPPPPTPPMSSFSRNHAHNSYLVS